MRRLLCWLTWHCWVNQRDGWPDVEVGWRRGGVKCERCDETRGRLRRAKDEPVA